MRVRITGIYEVRKPMEEEEPGLRRRHAHYLVSTKPGETVIVAQMAPLDETLSDCFGWDTPIKDLPEGSKLGDEFEIEFRPIKKGSK